MRDWLSKFSKFARRRQSSETSVNASGGIISPQKETPENHLAAPSNGSGAKDDSSSDLTVVLVDYDNVVLTAKRAGFQVSFPKLRDYCRTLGRIAIAEVFVPSHPLADDFFVKYLSNAGFMVVACPVGSKDKDRVDSFIQSRGIFYATHMNIGRIVVVSEDGDFSKNPNFTFPIRDAGKELVFLKPSDLRQRISVSPKLNELPPEFEKIDRFQKAITTIKQKQTGSNLDDRIDIGFVKTLILKAIELAEREDREYHFKQIVNLIWHDMSPKWDHKFNIADVTAALAAVVNENILVKKEKVNPEGEIVFKYYRSNPDHPVLKVINSARWRFS